MHNLSEMHAYTKPDIEVRVTYLSEQLCVCCLAACVRGFADFVAVIGVVLNLFHLTFRMDVSSPLSP